MMQPTRAETDSPRQKLNDSANGTMCSLYQQALDAKRAAPR